MLDAIELKLHGDHWDQYFFWIASGKRGWRRRRAVGGRRDAGTGRSTRCQNLAPRNGEAFTELQIRSLWMNHGCF